MESVVKNICKKNGFKVVAQVSHKNANGPDLHLSKNGKIYTCEIKNTRITERGSIQVPPVERNRKRDDFIAIVLPSKYVLFEKMKDHLKNTSRKGYRTLWQN